MKTRESGMPEEEMWKSFFDPELILEELGLDPDSRGIVDMGCGYGTFAIPAARRIRGMVHAIDVDPHMVEICQAKAIEAGVSNINCALRDFVTYGTCLPDASADFVMLFNILHAENPLQLLKEAWRILVTGGKVGVIHWNFDPSTPRGPSMDIRPRPEQCQQWIQSSGFKLIRPFIPLPPYHYGMVGQKESTL